MNGTTFGDALAALEAGHSVTDQLAKDWRTA